MPDRTGVCARLPHTKASKIFDSERVRTCSPRGVSPSFPKALTRPHTSHRKGDAMGKGNNSQKNDKKNKKPKKDAKTKEIKPTERK
jgi:hypothetical protein